MRNSSVISFSTKLLLVASLLLLGSSGFAQQDWFAKKSSDYGWGVSSWVDDFGPWATWEEAEADALQWCRDNKGQNGGVPDGSNCTVSVWNYPVQAGPTYWAEYKVDAQSAGFNTAYLEVRLPAAQFFVAEPTGQVSQCDRTNPCDVATGNKSQTESDYLGSGAASLSFSRYYNASGRFKTAEHNGIGWRHTYSRALNERPEKFHAFATAGKSSHYSSESDACTEGWGEIKGLAWSGALSDTTATFIGSGYCQISSGGSLKAMLPVRTIYHRPVFSAPSGLRTITRPNGGVHYFRLVGSDWINEMNPAVTLEASGSNWVFTDATDTRETYNSNGQLIQIDYRNGQTETLDYDLTVAEGGDSNPSTLDRVTGPFGHELLLAYDENHRLSSVATPDGTFAYGYDSDRNLETVTNPDGSNRQYIFEDEDLPNHMTGIIDENNVRYATWAYDAEGRAILSEHAGNKETVNIIYNPNGTSTVTLGNGAVRDYSFAVAQGRRRTTSVSGDVCSTCAGGDIADRTYDANGFLDSAFDWKGNETQTVRNAFGLTETLIEAKGSTEERTTTTIWHPTFRIPKKVISPKNTTEFTHDANGNVRTATVSSGNLSRTWTITPNAYGQPLTIDGPRTDVNDITTIVYHPCTTGGECGQIDTITNALGHVTTFDNYDAAGRPKLITDANGLQLSFTYDWRGNVLTMTQTPTSGVARITTMTYHDDGQLETLSTPDGMVLTYAYTPAHYLDSISDNFGNLIDYDYDVMGNLTDVDTYDPNNVLETALDYAYDLNNQLDTITHGGYLTDVSIDLVGNLTNEVDPKLAETVHSYDALNRLDETLDALTGITDYDYDDHDNLTFVEAANGAVTSYDYDDLDNLREEISPDRGTIIYTPDDAGNRKTRLDARGKLTTYDYDALNRLTLITLDNGETIDYEYDIGDNAVGRLNKITDSSGTTTSAYDNFGAVKQKVQTIGGIELSTHYDYDDEGRLKTVTYPSDKVVTYGYNSYQGDSVSVDGQTILSAATYEPFGPVDGWTWGNGSASSRNFDLRGLMDSLTLPGDTRALGYNAAGQLESAVDNTVSETYLYDLLGRLRLTTNHNSGGGGGSPSEPMFTSAPVVLATIQTTANETGSPPSGNPTPWITTAIRNVGSSSVQFALGRAEVDTGSINIPETVGYVAIAGGARGFFGTNDGTLAYEAQTTSDSISGKDDGCFTTIFLSSFATTPTVVATINTHGDDDGGWVRRCDLTSDAIGLTIDEDQYNDAERSHGTEAVGFAAFSQDFDVMWEDEFGTWGMEAAIATLPATGVNSTFAQISFRQTYTTPPIVIVLATNEGGEPSAIRIRNVTATGFEAVQVEPAGNDGPHVAMTLHYLAIEPGAHELPDGTRLLAATVSVSNQQHGAGVTGVETWLTETFADWPSSGAGGTPDSTTFTYDANGNRESLTQGAATYDYSNQPGSNRLLSTDGPVAKTYSHDASGNVIGDGLHTYGYDDRGRLVTVDGGAAPTVRKRPARRVREDEFRLNDFWYNRPRRFLKHDDPSRNVISDSSDSYDIGDRGRIRAVGGGGATYLYNGQGQRVQKDNGSVTLFVYDEAGNLLGEYDGSGAATQEHVWFNGAPVALLEGASHYYVHTDQLGTPRFITDGDRLAWRWHSDPFGSTVPYQISDSDEAPLTYNLRFPGQYYDQETGLHYNYFRTLDPATGRYLESDPIGLAGGPNTYAYVGGNPLSFADPYGLKTCILVTRNSSGFGNHAALWSDGSTSTGGPYLYDPAGSYVPTKEQQGDFTSGANADMDAFEDFHRKKYDDSTERACMETTDEEEEKIFSNILNRNQCSGLFCANCVSSVLNGVPSFEGVNSLFPGNLPGQVGRNRMPQPKLWEKPTAP